MNDIKVRNEVRIEVEIELEQGKLFSLDSIKNQILYIIPKRINSNTKRTIIDTFWLFLLDVIFNHFIGFIFMFKYISILMGSVLSGVIISFCYFLYQYSKRTKDDRRKLKMLKRKYGVYGLDVEITKCKENIKELERELLRIQNTIPNEKREHPRYARNNQQQVTYYYDDEYITRRRR